MRPAFPALLIVLLTALVAVPATASAPSAQADGAQQTTVSASKRRITVKVQVDRFAVKGERIVARGSAASKVLTRDGMVRRQKQPVELSVKAGNSCRVLYLRLDDLQVKLLGLELDTSTITLRVKGESDRVLGRLFCQLAKAIKLERVTDATGIVRSLNRPLARQPMDVLGFRAALFAQTAQASAPGQTPSCPLLDLTIGPLNLDLLGLVVDLYGADTTQPVRVVATANRAGGVLGTTLCKLANGEAVI
ncbi:MAG: hypothetical protein WKF96_09325 [Solirubrobacteraceae bacterium]